MTVQDDQFAAARAQADQAIMYYSDHLDRLLRARSNLTGLSRADRVSVIAAQLFKADHEPMELCNMLAITLERLSEEHSRAA